MKRRSKAIVVLLLSFCSLTMAATGCKDLICYVDYIDTLTCTYNNDKHGIGKTLNSMDVEWTLEESVETCELIPSDGKNEYTCNIDMEDFFFDTGCTVFINPANNWNDALRKTCGPFKIGEKFMPRAPFNLTVSLSENYNISWRSLYDNEVYRSYMLAYELAYKTNAESWLNQKTVQLYEDEKSLVLLRSLFKADEIYVARIRARPKNSSIYRGHWGSWSTPVLWRTPKDGISLEKSWQNWVIILMVLFSLSVAIVLFAFKWPKCLWKNVWVLIPNPAPFFKPLYMVHHGDFKSWLGSSYYQAKPFPEFPEIFEVYSQSLLKAASRQDLNSLEKHKFLLTNSWPNRDSQDCTNGGCNKAVLDKDSGSLPIGTEACPHFNTRDGPEADINRSGDDSYPCVNLDSDNSTMLDLMLDRKLDSQATTGSLIHSNFQMQEDCLGPNLNILDLLPASPEGWEFQDSPSQDDDENVFYNDNYNSLSPDSANSADFRYPRICLDLDTIDSGFCDSECGSPVDSDFGNSGTPSKQHNSDSYSGEEGVYERNYVKQWVPCHSIPAESVTETLIE